jgi:hypothetical protein
MSLRIGVDLDGTLADLSAAYHELEARIFGAAASAEKVDDASATDDPSRNSTVPTGRERERRQEAVWREIRATKDFWTTLSPLEPTAVRDLHRAALDQNWEVFFITQRPQTAGSPAQLQSQRWLIEHGFPTPSVLTLTGSRGKAAHALDLDFLIDDLPKNCVDVLSDSKCQPILIVRDSEPTVEIAAKRMKIGIVRTIAEAVDLLSRPAVEPRASLVTRVLGRLGLAR